ncbi:GAF domain-containing protein [Solirubrobacter ginsenosidimutans]|uniref:histidine kinase n=1 Tax=Solirubrobacter ginsenosidimutans TaxID=490573 RepID=A0A9X3MZK5_9ACTN|nr:GAF domain-containing protein [Solirubrobacter ginsenosidimutans]MDA0165670.1 GAF domain-containing protein [Solirubrobacter ginsenosidimutans]
MSGRRSSLPPARAIAIASAAAAALFLTARRLQASEQERRRLADEQAALRRVATLVARSESTEEVFEAVVREVGLLCDADLARMERFEADRTVTAIAAWSRDGQGRLAVGTRFELQGASIAAQVYETSQAARVDSFAGASGPIAHEAETLGIRSSVGCPIVVGGRIWGVIAASTTRDTPFPPNTESRIAEFTELVATAVANGEARSALIASRVRLVTAADDARRRVARDLHDGAQQRLVGVIAALKLAQLTRASDDGESWTLVGEALAGAEAANAELRELAHGILPHILARGGLQAGVSTLVSRMRVPVNADVPGERFAADVEASAYFIVAEALTNVAKHSRAQRADVRAWVTDGLLHLDVRDNGVGGARSDGNGLTGLRDRVDALGGRLRVESPRGGGTRIAASLPLRAHGAD